LTRIAVFIAVAASVLSASDDKPGRKIRLGSVSVSGSYISGPGWYPYYGYYPGWSRWYLYDPLFYSPYIHSGLYSGFAYRADMGEVKLAASDQDASVYIDGAYAGPANKLKTLWLDPGAYNLELRDTSGQRFERRIYVLTGKTLQIRAQLK
jgi:hypothetical protein